jgi:uncharacterized membrane protein
MRSVADRIRHALSFEILGLVIITPIGAWAFDTPMSDIGIVGIGAATLATGWNYLYNLGFDHFLERSTGTTLKTIPMRIIHAVLFEAGLVTVLLPFIAWYLEISMWQAFVMDLSLSLFYLVYAFVFNWSYDRLFPLPEWQTEAPR